MDTTTLPRPPAPVRPVLLLLALLAAGPTVRAGQGALPPPDEAWRTAVTYEAGQSRRALRTIELEVASAVDDRDARAAIEPRLVALLEAESATPECRAFACRQLALVGSSASVPALAALLRDDASAHPARLALRVIPGPAPDDALLAAVRDPAVDGDRLVGVINTIGARGTVTADALLEALGARRTDDDVMVAATVALGKLGGDRASEHLAKILARAGDRPAVREAALEALLVALAPDDGRAWIQLVLYQADRLPDARDRRRFRFAALRELGRRDATAGAEAMRATLDDDDPTWRRDAQRLVIETPGSETTTAYAALLPELSPTARVAVISALGTRGDDAAANAVADQAADPDAVVRDAALLALGEIGGAGHVRLLVEHATAEQEAAAIALRRLGADGVDEMLATMAELAPPAQRVLIARTLGERQADGQAATLQRLARPGQPPAVRTAALIALAALAPADDEAGTAALTEAMDVAADASQRRWVLETLVTRAQYRELPLATRWLDDPEIGVEASRVAIAIARAAPPEAADAAIAAIERVLATRPDDAELRVLAGAAISHVDRYEGFIEAWVLSGPYTADGEGGRELFDIAFAPEPGHPDTATWVPVPAEARPEPGVVDLAAALGGTNRAAYLATVLHADTERTVRLELGSDDTLRVWLNDAPVHANPAMRGLTPGDDVVTVTLRPGPNDLLLKVTQGGGGWAACCRVRTAEGFRIEGVNAAVPGE